MDKKFLIKSIVFNTLWLAWIGLSVFFGFLIAKAYFPDNLLTLIPFSLIFIVVGIVPAAFAFRKLYKSGNQKPADNGNSDLKSEEEQSSITSVEGRKGDNDNKS